MPVIPWHMAVCLAAMCIPSAPALAEPASSLEEGFRNPPDSAKPHTWYHVMNGNATKEGVTYDFEAIAAAGLGGVQLFDVDCGIPPGPMAFGSPEWFDFLRHAACEARRLGLDFGLANCAGWSSSGGPWNAPSNAMKVVTFSETAVKGPGRFSGTLPRRMDDGGWYEDIAVLAFPTPSGDRRLTDIGMKTLAYRDAHGKNIPLPRDAFDVGPDEVVRPDEEIDLTSWMAPDGSLTWDVPEGNWTILRVGAICNSKCNHPASAGGRGLEVDKLSASAVDNHFNQYAGRLCRMLGLPNGDGGRGGLNGLLVDSFEVGSQNWTPGLDRIFEERTSYSPRPWMPVFAGRIVGSVDESERFLEDFRRVVADLFAENYAGTLARNCHRFGLAFSLEPYGNGPSDHLQYGREADIPMGECWSRAGAGDHETTGAGAGKLASSLAHVWGRRYAAMESFTAEPNAGGRWTTTPFSIKAQCDRMYSEGINRIVYHRFVHQPWPGESYLPGMTMGRWGMHLDRTQTWWRHAPAWFRYQSRCQWMLQEGRFVADVLFYGGEHAPNQGRQTDGVKNPGDMRLPYGYDWDICAVQALELLRVEDGRIVTPGGVSYRLLVLPPFDTMSVKVLETVERLVDTGANVCGMEKPIRAPGLVGHPGASEKVQELADQVWAKGVLTCPPAEALGRLGVEPDFGSNDRDARNGAVFIHRRNADADWYFVACNNKQEKTLEVDFRQTGRQPEIWDAETGTIRDAPQWHIENGRTYVSLTLPPSGSSFVVFRKPALGNGATNVVATVEHPPVSVNGSWLVSFPPGWGAPESVEFPELVSWTVRPEPGIRYFSGTAAYAKIVPFRTPTAGRRTVLDLGDVRNFAVVKVNGKAFPVLWRPPFRLDITDALDPGATSFELKVEITNLWPNRLIGDELLPEDREWTGVVKDGVREIGLREIPDWVLRGGKSPTGRFTFTTWKHWDKDDEPLQSGLLGPVVLRTIETAKIVEEGGE